MESSIFLLAHFSLFLDDQDVNEEIARGRRILEARKERRGVARQREKAAVFGHSARPTRTQGAVVGGGKLMVLVIKAANKGGGDGPVLIIMACGRPAALENMTFRIGAGSKRLAA
jgi:hypothetical protein